MPFDIQAAKAAGYTDAEIIPYLASAYPDFDVEKAVQSGYSLEEVGQHLNTPQTPSQDGLSGNVLEDVVQGIPRIAKETFFEAGDKTREFTENLTQKLPQPSPERSFAGNILTGIPGAVTGTVGELAAQQVDPISLALLPFGGAVAKGAAKVGKGFVSKVGKALSGVEGRTIGKLVDDPGALAAGIKESFTGSAGKAFGDAKTASNIRNIKPGAEALDEVASTSFARKQLGKLKTALKERKGLAKLESTIKESEDFLENAVTTGKEKGIEAGMAKLDAAKKRVEAIKESLAKVPEYALETRQAIDDMSAKALAKPSVMRLRDYTNKVLDKTAPLVRKADALVSRAKLGQEFLDVRPAGAIRKLVSAGGLGAGALNPTSLAIPAIMSPAATGLTAAGIGVGSKLAKGATKTLGRRAVIATGLQTATKERK